MGWRPSLHALLGGSPCVSCGAPGGALCRPCAAGVGAPLADEPVPGIARVVAAWAYAGAARDLVLDLKLRARREAAEPLVAAMAGAVWRAGTSADVLTWVPARRTDVRRRGFDHAEVLARGLGRRLGLPARPLLERVGRAPDQASLSARERRVNPAGGFRARGSPAAVGVVDDLLTTGSTLTACAAALRAAGVPAVDGLVACRA
ncbi:MAG TPA: ComF family protein [Actinomycetota bacterium]|nr:ComF family protein [Actinomycetota bacterium]